MLLSFNPDYNDASTYGSVTNLYEIFIQIKICLQISTSSIYIA